MQDDLTRRDLLKTTGAGLFLGPSVQDLFIRKRRKSTPALDLAERLAATSRADVFDLVLERARAGLAWDELLAAVFLAGVTEIRPRPVGFKLHAVFVVESMFQLAAGAPGDERWLAALWNLSDFKESQARDAREGDWRLAPPPEVSFSSKEAAAGELAAAMQAWDAERADRAVAGALPLLGLDELFELLWPFAFRDFSNLGHKPIFATHVARTLARIGEQYAEPALRALVHGLLDEAPGPHAEECEASRGVAATLRPGWSEGERAPERSVDIARDLRHATSEDARARVAKELNAGVDPSTLWDALRLVATDLFARRPALLPVHPTTVTSALAHLSRTSRSDDTRRVALLQAASWLPLYRGALGLPMDAPGLDPVLDAARAEPVGVDELFDEPSPERASACLASGRTLAPFHTRLRAHLLRCATEHHMPKYAAVLLEDSSHTDERWRPALMAHALRYLPSAGSRASAVHERSRELVARLRG